MQATLDVTALRPFTRALNCLMKYGEELTVHATAETLSLSSVNSSKSAYCRFQYDASFFSRYNVGKPGARQAGVEVNGQLLTKSILSILKHRTVEKSAERCELSIVEGSPEVDEVAEHDSLESKLIIRLHCKHGIVKTHRLLMLTPTILMAPSGQDSSDESRVTMGPRALKDMIDHFPVNKGSKSDPQLVWAFSDGELTLKSLESSMDGKGRGQLTTELAMSAEEFDSYDISSTPITIAFHLREFNVRVQCCPVEAIVADLDSKATIAFTDSMKLPLEMRFTQPAAPLFIDVEGDSFDCLFVLSTSQVSGAQSVAQTQSSATSNRKRSREETVHETPRTKKPVKAVQVARLPSTLGSNSRQLNRSMPPPSGGRSTTSFSQPPFTDSTHQDMLPPPPPSAAWNAPPSSVRKAPESDAEPLFLPCSQLSQAEVEVIRSTGLGIEDMNADELAEMLDGEGEEVVFHFTQPSQPVAMFDNVRIHGSPDSLDLVDEFGATQSSEDQSRAFQPLFED